ncbi:caffeoylshikimate esterase-like [Hibiscus syriacus]|uniref:Caffeoylshikimate esterase-like n=1 Tax=Hibiscus syriacus TaxID=106335 RepID=A0A6A2YP71_HIBSY|nr:caffeoylshikimate esterase-like [Hibiscus syriacus]
MGSEIWLRSFICLKKPKSRRSKQAETNEKSNGDGRIDHEGPEEGRSPATTRGSQSSPRNAVEHIAAARIQKAFRDHRARKTVRRSQIRARRICTVTEGRLKKKRLENQMKLEAKLHDLEVERCGGSETMEEIINRIQQREEAAVKRERTMAYAFPHQWRANASQYLGQASYGVGKENCGWSWIERWIAARPWEVRVHSQPIHLRKTHGRQASKSDKDIENPASTEPSLPNEKVASKVKTGPQPTVEIRKIHESYL